MFRARIKELRKAAKLTQKDLADELFISQQSVGKWESGISMPTPETLSKLANRFNVTVDYLLGISDDPSGVLKVSLTDVDPQVQAITDKAKQLNSKGLNRLEQYADDLLAAEIYQKKEPPLTMAARGGKVVKPEHPVDVEALDKALNEIEPTDNL